MTLPADILDKIRANALTTLEIRGKGDITVDEMKTLCEALKTNTSVSKVFLPSCRITPASVRALAEVLKVNTTIRELGLWNNWLEDAGAEILAEGLRANKGLTDLNLTQNGIGNKGVKALLSAARENPNILTLSCDDYPDFIVASPVFIEEARELGRRNWTAARELFYKAKDRPDQLLLVDIAEIRARLPAFVRVGMTMAKDAEIVADVLLTVETAAGRVGTRIDTSQHYKALRPDAKTMFQGQTLAEVFNASKWAGKTDAMRKLWETLPPRLQKDFDFADALTKAQIESVRQQARNKRRGKLDLK